MVSDSNGYITQQQHFFVTILDVLVWEQSDSLYFPLSLFLSLFFLKPAK